MASNIKDEVFQKLQKNENIWSKHEGGSEPIQWMFENNISMFMATFATVSLAENSENGFLLECKRTNTKSAESSTTPSMPRIGSSLDEMRDPQTARNGQHAGFPFSQSSQDFTEPHYFGTPPASGLNSDHDKLTLVALQQLCVLPVLVASGFSEHGPITMAAFGRALPQTVTD